MAISDNEGKFKGKIGNLTYRIIDGITIVQSSPGPGTVKQTSPTKISSKEFSLASNRAKILRLILFPMIKGKQDNKMVNRFTSVMSKVIRANNSLPSGYRDLMEGELSLLTGFEFNLNSPFFKVFKTSIRMFHSKEEGIRISMDGLNAKTDIAFPQVATGCILRILLCAISLKDNLYQYCGSAELKITDQSDLIPAKDWVFKQNLPENSLFMATCSLEFYAEGLFKTISLNNSSLHPVAIIGLARGEEFIGQLPLLLDANSMWNNWHPIPGIDGNKLRKH
jgi:hypothetical protein